MLQRVFVADLDPEWVVTTDASSANGDGTR